MIAKLTEKLKLKKQLKEIHKHLKLAVMKSTENEIKTELKAVLNELYSFEEQNRNNIGYTKEIYNSVINLYSKIGKEQNKYEPYINNDVYLGDID